ncbi:RimK/LysX family protein [Gelidibacter sp.]|uniref:putative ATP-dependent zinc protease n=1 Tax=Gelidibacter sp. TaxID=2018083 RepID=UPI0032664E8A
MKTQIILFDKKYNISLTLSTREDMRFPVLIGRKFISKKFIVDVTQKDLSYNNKNK